MKAFRIAVLFAFAAPMFGATDKASTYQMGVFVSSSARGDGTVTSTLHGDGTTTAGSVFANQVAVYILKVADGVWHLETYTQNKDSMLRNMGMTPMHLKAEKDNPLDLLKGGERVLFRVESHRKLNGTEISVFIPYADKPDKEFHFIGYFYPDAAPSEPKKATDNVKAMCEAHKLSADLEKQYCGQQALEDKSSSATTAAPTDNLSQYSPLDVQTAKNIASLSYTQVKSLILANKQIAQTLQYTWKIAQVRCPE